MVYTVGVYIDVCYLTRGADFFVVMVQGVFWKVTQRTEKSRWLSRSLPFRLLTQRLIPLLRLHDTASSADAPFRSHRIVAQTCAI